jgi:soluble lytic murein transglycosylase
MQRGVLLAILTVPLAGFADDEEDGAALSEQQLEELLGSSEPVPPPSARKYSESDFAPYFTSGVAAEAKAQLEQGHWVAARQLLEHESGDAPVRYLQAWTALLSGDSAAAAAEFSALGGDYPALADHCALHAGEAYERLNQPALALQAYQRVREGSTPFPDARFGVARLLKRRLDVQGALDALKPLRELPAGWRWNPVRVKALVTTAELARFKRNGRGDELRALFEIWASSPDSPEAEQAWQRLKDLRVPNAVRVKRAEALLALNRNAQAMELAGQVTTSMPEEQACRAAFVLGNGLRKERVHKRAIAVLAPMTERCRTSELRPQALYVMGYSQSVVDPEGAIRTYERLAREYPKHPMADDALFFAAEMYVRTARDALAIERLREVVSRYPEGNFAAESLFKLAHLSKNRGELDQAYSALQAVEKLPQQLPSEVVLRARYWTARVLAAQNDFAAEDLFRELAYEHPTTWYGVLASVRVGDAPPSTSPSGRAPAPDVGWPLDSGTLGSDPHFIAGIELLRMGLPGSGFELLAADRRSLSDDAARLLVFSMRRAGVDKAAEVVARATLGRELTGVIDDRSRPVWEATYPRTFRPEVEKSARAAKVDPDLLQALARQESLFNATARSATGALGLTQLMPATANKVARGMRLGRVSAAALFRPELNLRLGAAYLGSLLTEFDGNAAHAVAAYNAGPEAVRRWVHEREDVELDQWVEEIPYAETRDYVKHVLASYAAYQHVYASMELAETDGPAPRLERQRQ